MYTFYISQVQLAKRVLLWHHVAGGKAGYEYETLAVKPEGKRPLGVTDVGKSNVVSLFI
jgi:hypothetical protein